MTTTYNKYLLKKGLDKIIELNGKKSFEKFLNVYITDELRKRASNFPHFCNGLKYLPFGDNNMLKIKLEPVNKTRCASTVTGENDEIIFTDEIPSLSQERLELLLIQVTSNKSMQQKTFLIENNF